MDGGSLWLKCEFLQHTGVFKTRGAFNRQLAALERGELSPETGIVVASGGNAGLANAYVASALGVPATVFVPENAPKVKVERLRSYGATVHQVGTEYAQAYEAAVAHAGDTHAVFCHAYDQPEVAAAQALSRSRSSTTSPAIDTIVVAVGGGGLFAGVAAATEGRARTVAVEPVSIPTLHAALEANEPVDVPVAGIAADSLGARRLGDIAFDVAIRTRPTCAAGQRRRHQHRPARRSGPTTGSPPNTAQRRRTRPSLRCLHPRSGREGGGRRLRRQHGRVDVAQLAGSA